MVNFHNPVVILEDFGEFFYGQTRELKEPIGPTFDSGNRLILARPGWSLLVSLP
jgi:hypothetical protein